MTAEELFERAIPEPNSGCWLWLGGVDKDGYGVVTTRPQTYAHRLSYSVHCAAIPRGAIILHSCDQPSCINPDHLRCGTHQDNSDDRVRRGRAGAARGMDSSSAKLNDDKVRAIRSDDRSLRDIARDYGIDAVQVSRVKRRLSWRHVS